MSILEATQNFRFSNRIHKNFERQRLILTKASDIVTDIMNDLLHFHQRQEAIMTDGFRQLADILAEDKEDLLTRVQQLCGEQGNAMDNSKLQILAGQQDLQRNLDRLSDNFSDAMHSNDMRTAHAMEKLLREQQAALQALMNTTSSQSRDCMVARIQELVSLPSQSVTTKVDIKIGRPALMPRWPKSKLRTTAQPKGSSAEDFIYGQTLSSVFAPRL